MCKETPNFYIDYQELFSYPQSLQNLCLSHILPSRSSPPVDKVRIHQLGVSDGILEFLQTHLCGGVLGQAEREETRARDGQVVVGVLL